MLCISSQGVCMIMGTIWVFDPTSATCFTKSGGFRMCGSSMRMLLHCPMFELHTAYWPQCTRRAIQAGPHPCGLPSPSSCSCGHDGGTSWCAYYCSVNFVQCVRLAVESTTKILDAPPFLATLACAQQALRV